MALRIAMLSHGEVDWDEVHNALGKRLWLTPSVLAMYPTIDVLIVRRGCRLISCWPVPVSTAGKEGRAAVRPFRLLPYTGPTLSHETGLRSFTIHELLAGEMATCYDVVDLPLAPVTYDLIAYVSQGMTPIWRTTYRLHESSSLVHQVCEMTRRAIRHASHRIEIFPSPANDFNFVRGLTQCGAAELELRARTAQILGEEKQAITLNAHIDNEVVGQLLAVIDDVSGYLFHSWHLNEGEPGVTAMLILEAATWALRHRGVSIFDLEGSVLAGVARFYASFGATVSPYAQLRKLQSEGVQLSDYMSMR